MLEKLHTLVGPTYYWPQPEVDPGEDFEYVIGSISSRSLIARKEVARPHQRRFEVLERSRGYDV